MHIVCAVHIHIHSRHLYAIFFLTTMNVVGVVVDVVGGGTTVIRLFTLRF